MRPGGESDSEGEGDIEEYRGGVLYSWARASPPDMGIDLEGDTSQEEPTEAGDQPGPESGQPDWAARPGRIGASEQQLR